MCKGPEVEMCPVVEMKKGSLWLELREGRGQRDSGLGGSEKVESFPR
jgi:hypothetical protein